MQEDSVLRKVIEKDLEVKSKKVFYAQKAKKVAKEPDTKKRRVGKRKQKVEEGSGEDFILPHNTEGYVDHYCLAECVAEWKATKRDFICTYYVCQSIGVGGTADATFFAWMDEKRPTLWAQVLDRVVEYNLNLHASEFEKLPTQVIVEGKLD